MKPEPSQSPAPLSLDDRLRKALEPVDGQGERIARRALQVDPAPSRRPAWRPWTWAAAAAAGLALAVLFVRPTNLEPPQVDPVAEQASAIGFENTPLPERLTISNLDGALTVTSPSGATTVILRELQ